MDDPNKATAGAERWLVVPVIVGCGVLVGLALLSARHNLDQRRQLVDTLATVGVAEAGQQPVRRESVPHHARLHAARALVYNALVRLREDSGPTRQQAIDAVPEAGRLAAGVLEDQPNSWQAAMLYGTAVYLERSVNRDRRLVTEAADWERPLDRAVREAPGQPEPRRLLATAYLETWHNLSADKQQRAKTLMADVFRDDARAFEALAPAWLGLGLDRAETFSVVPDDPIAWQVFETSFAQARRYHDAAAAYQERFAALERQLDAQRGEAEARLRLGDYFRARSMLLRVVLNAPPSQRFAPLVSRALEVYPPGLHGLSSPDRLQSWLEWSIELDRVGVDGLPAVAIGRLLDAVGEIDPHLAAHAALVAEDRYQAERFEKLAQPLTLAVWAPYLMSKARRLADAGDHDAAREAIDQVALGARSGLAYRIAESRVAGPSGGASLDEVRATRWDALAWRWRRGRPMLEILPARRGAGLAIRLDDQGDGAVVDVRLDGRTLGVQAVYPGQVLRFDVDVEARPHVLEVRTVVGRDVTPGDAWLLTPPADRDG